MNIDFRTGRPREDGNYVVVTKAHSVANWHFTMEYGWNTYRHSHESAIPDETVVAWTDNFAQQVIDIYGQDDIMEESEDED